MSTPNSNNLGNGAFAPLSAEQRARLRELLAAAAAQDLSAAEAAELARFDGHPEAELERERALEASLDLVVAMSAGPGQGSAQDAVQRSAQGLTQVVASGASGPAGAVPSESLKAKLHAQAQAHLVRTSQSAALGGNGPKLRFARDGEDGGSGTRAGTGRGGFGSLVPWAIAAACAIAAVIGFSRPSATPTQITLAGAPDVVEHAMSAQADEMKAAKAAADIRWSPSREVGELTVANLPVVAASEGTYQLWIVDPTRDSKPVDAGTFLVGADGSAKLTFKPKLPIRKPVAFAITKEKPGGSVVHEGPILMLYATQ